MEDIIARTRIGKTWSKIPTESKMTSKIPREDKRPEKPVLKCYKCGSTSHLANTCTKKTKINEVQVIEEVKCNEEKEESDQDSEISEQYIEDCYSLINFHDARMCKTKPARGKGYTSGASCITSILMNNVEAKVNLDTEAFCTCVGKDYLQAVLPEWKNHLLPI
ncbi:hypothetical protein O181_110516 [Austropuccinia psidii MF-1]|uniref:CCHC-type domain-containing protein n=1 Tax=Austropuccinia psidii MF-1 TaxID=1389203 RepID=A0A9Q3PRV5_9BASI|nr:hypothetical protein [Austropuccinia psidii MF-1]